MSTTYTQTLTYLTEGCKVQQKQGECILIFEITSPSNALFAGYNVTQIRCHRHPAIALSSPPPIPFHGCFILVNEVLYDIMERIISPRNK